MNRNMKIGSWDRKHCHNDHMVVHHTAHSAEEKCKRVFTQYTGLLKNWFSHNKWTFCFYSTSQWFGHNTSLRVLFSYFFLMMLTFQMISKTLTWWMDTYENHPVNRVELKQNTIYILDSSKQIYWIFCEFWLEKVVSTVLKERREALSTDWLLRLPVIQHFNSLQQKFDQEVLIHTISSEQLMLKHVC